MIHHSAPVQDSHQIFVIQPNRSMSWRGLLWVYAGIAAITLSVGIFWFFAGLPLVLPFSGLEMMLLGAAFYLSARGGDVREVVTIDENTLAVESGRNAPERRAEFQRHWARIVLEQRWNGRYPSPLLVRSHGRQVEIGKFLNEQERRGLAAHLGAVLRQGRIVDHQGARPGGSNQRGMTHVG